MEIKKIKSAITEDRKIRVQIGILAMVFGALMTFMSWLQISKYTFNEFDYICKDVNYQSCMRWFWQTKGFFQAAEIVSIAVLVASLVFIAINKKKKPVLNNIK